MIKSITVRVLFVMSLVLSTEGGAAAVGRPMEDIVAYELGSPMAYQKIVSRPAEAVPLLLDAMTQNWLARRPELWAQFADEVILISEATSTIPLRSGSLVVKTFTAESVGAIVPDDERTSMLPGLAKQILLSMGADGIPYVVNACGTSEWVTRGSANFLTEDWSVELLATNMELLVNAKKTATGECKSAIEVALSRVLRRF